METSSTQTETANNTRPPFVARQTEKFVAIAPDGFIPVAIVYPADGTTREELAALADRMVSAVNFFDGAEVPSDSLRAAAPKMLAALKAVLPALIRLGDFVGNVDDGGPSGQGRIDRVALILQVHHALEAAAR